MMTVRKNTSSGKALFSSDGRCLRADPQLQKMLGYSSGELLNKTFQDIIPPECLQQVLDSTHRLWVGKIRPFSLKTWFIHKDGSIIPINFSVSPVRKLSGKPYYLMAVLQELQSEKKNVETSAILQTG